jgi:hypothetical protein
MRMTSYLMEFSGCFVLYFVFYVQLKVSGVPGRQAVFSSCIIVSTIIHEAGKVYCCTDPSALILHAQRYCQTPGARGRVCPPLLAMFD